MTEVPYLRARFVWTICTSDWPRHITVNGQRVVTKHPRLWMLRHIVFKRASLKLVEVS